MVKKIISLCSATVLYSLVLLPLPAMAATMWWQAGGPEGGSAQVLTIDPTNPETLYAASGSQYNGDGVLKSINGGLSWTLLSNGLTSISVISLAVDPINSQIVYAGSRMGGVFKSSDGGDSWIPLNSGLLSNSVESLAIDPSTPGTLYAALWGGGIFKSINGGESWSAVNSGLTTRNVFNLVIDPITPQTIYVTTLDGGVFKSINGGNLWSAVNSGITNSWVFSLAIDTSSHETIYAVTNGGGVFKSTTSGGYWNPVNIGLNSLSVRSVAVDPTQSQTVYVGTDIGVFKTTDGGGLWSRVSNGLPVGYVNSIVIDPSSSQSVYAGTESSGVFKSVNAGGAWSAVNSGLVSTLVTKLTMDPTNSMIIYAGTLGSGLFKSADGGVSWSAANNGLTGSYISSIAIDPTNPLVLYSGVEGGGLFKSTNGGAAWNAANSGLTTYIYSIAIDPANSQTLYAGTDAGVFKSTTGGASWSAISSGLTGTSILCLAVDPTVPQTIYAGTNADVFKTTTGGASWSAISKGLAGSYVYALTIDPSAPQIVYAGAGSGQVFKTTTAGDLWFNISSGVTSLDVYSIAVDPTDGQTVYAGTDSGVFKSMNGGSSWSIVNSGLSNIYVTALLVDPIHPHSLYAGTFGNGVYKGFSDPPPPTVSGTPDTAATVGTVYKFIPSSTYASSFSISGSVPPGLAFNAATGALSGIPTTAGSYGAIQIKAISFAGTASLPEFDMAVTLPVPVFIATPAHLSNSTSAGFAFNPAPSAYYTFECKLDSGDFLPCSSPQGYISLAEGTHTFQVRAVDQAKNYTPLATYVWMIDSMPPVDGTLSAIPGPGQVSLSWTGFSDPMTGLDKYKLVAANGTLPASCASGTLIYSGTDTSFVHTGLTKGITYSYRLCALDKTGNVSNGITASAKVMATPLLISTTSTLPSGIYGCNFSKAIPASGGTKPYTWSVVSGEIPAGITLDAAKGTLKGKPTGWGDYTFTVQVADKYGYKSTKDFTLSINVPQLTITTAALPNGRIGVSYKKVLAGKGGVKPFAWSVSAASLPNGLTLDAATGIISGMPTAGGTYSFSIQLEDGRPEAVTKDFTMAVK
jgi:photosystem II stability/assembly factor-like uncharacterized protein